MTRNPLYQAQKALKVLTIYIGDKKQQMEAHTLSRGQEITA